MKVRTTLLPLGEWALLPWSRERRIPIMAYSPIGNNEAEQKRIFDHASVKSVAARHNATPAQIALAWLLRHPDLVVIPKASKPEHIRDNRTALDIELTAQDLKDLDQSFPPPDRKIPLELL